MSGLQELSFAIANSPVEAGILFGVFIAILVGIKEAVLFPVRKYRDLKAADERQRDNHVKLYNRVDEIKYRLENEAIRLEARIIQLDDCQFRDALSEFVEKEIEKYIMKHIGVTDENKETGGSSANGTRLVNHLNYYGNP